VYPTGEFNLFTSNVNKFVDNIKTGLRGEGYGVMGWT
jgi:hypothetical protein